MELSVQLKKLALELGFDDVGIALAHDDLPFAKDFLAAHKEGRFGPLDYLIKTKEARHNLQTVFPGAQSVVVVVKNYYTGDHPKMAEKKAKIARYAWGKDYHQWFKKRLRKLQTGLLALANIESAKTWIFNDTGPFLERAWAQKAGLGFIGKSAMLIHRSLGTWTIIGGLATDLKLHPDEPYKGPDCGTCTRCLDACPTQAIISPRKVDARLCIATWTIERPLHADAPHLAPRDHDWGFGCDVCQEVCPWNKFQQITEEDRFQPLPGRVFLDAETFRQDLNGSPLNRAKKAGLMVNFLRIQKTLTHKNRRVF